MQFKKSFYFIRHGETQWNLERIYQGQNDIPLNQNGIAQAVQLSKSKPLAECSEVFVSPLKRAKHTAELLIASAGSPVNLIEVEQLMECKSEQCARYLLGLRGTKSMPSFEKLSGFSESPGEFIERVGQGLNFVLQSSCDNKPIIVAHGGVCTALCNILKIDYFSTPNCCIINFDFDGKNYSAKIINLS